MSIVHGVINSINTLHCVIVGIGTIFILIKLDAVTQASEHTSHGYSFANAVNFGDTNQTVFKVTFSLVLCLEMPDGCYFFSTFDIYAVKQLVGDFLKTVVTGHWYICCTIPSAAEDYRIVPVFLIMTRIGNTVEIELTPHCSPITYNGLIVIVTYCVAI